MLIRAAVQDDPKQGQARHKGPRRGRFGCGAHCYKKSVSDISDAIRRLMRSANVVTNRPAIEAGLCVLDAGGDFADGVIAFEGDWLGADEFASFDAKAVSLLQSQGKRARLL